MSSQNGLSSLTTFQERYRINVDSMMMMMMLTSLGPQNVIQCQNVVPTRVVSWELTDYLHSTIWATNCMYLPGIREVELGDSKLLPNELPSCYLGETTTNNLKLCILTRKGQKEWRWELNWQTAAKFFANSWAVSLTIKALRPEIVCTYQEHRKWVRRL